MSTITFITDTWITTNVSGVVTWLINTKKHLEARGFTVTIIYPGQFTSFPLPTYPEIKISLLTRKKMEEMIRESAPDYIHIATEGPLGLTARAACLKNNWKFTTFYHTRMPEYLSIRFKALKGPTYQYMRWFHNASTGTMVSTASLKAELERKRFKHIALVPLGVDIREYQKNPAAQVPPGLKKPIFVYLGRIAPEKNLEAFLECNLPGSKLIIGDGPARIALEEKYKERATFVGYKKGTELADLLSVSDVFVFPSKTDTFGLTIIEALACGLPVAAYDVQGPNDIITNGEDGFLGEDLETNAKKCLALGPEKCIQKAQKYTWENSVQTFVENLVRID